MGQVDARISTRGNAVEAREEFLLVNPDGYVGALECNQSSGVVEVKVALYKR